MSLPIIHISVEEKGDLKGLTFGENYGACVQMWYSEEEKERAMQTLLKLVDRLQREILGE